MRILIIEDEEGVRASLGILLPKWSDIVFAHTMKDAIEVLKGKPFDYVFLDLGLPDSERDETLKSIPAIRAMSGDAGLIIVTATESHLGQYELAADCIVRKPFDRMDIDNAIAKAQAARVTGNAITRAASAFIPFALAFRM